MKLKEHNLLFIYKNKIRNEILNQLRLLRYSIFNNFLPLP